VDESPDGTVALARTAAEAIRTLNHATLGGDGLGQPADAYAVLGELSLAASRLPQFLAAGRLGGADGPDPACAVSGAWLFLSDARGSAAALARNLEQARQQLASVNGEPSRKEARS
jgi:hypothetical protein